MLIAHHLQPAPVALLSIEGINTFRHSSFNSSTLLTPEPLPDAEMEAVISLPLAVGVSPKGNPSVFEVEMLMPDGSKNPNYKPPTPEVEVNPPKHSRGELYDYFTYKNSWLDLVGSIDPGYVWAKDGGAKDRVSRWPPTVIFHGNEDFDVPLDVSQAMKQSLGDDKVKLIVADGQPHLFEGTKFIEDEAPGMEAVKEAVAVLDSLVVQS